MNAKGFITEGSRSNFFAVFGNSLITPPANQVLKGITRKMVISLAINNGIELIERPIHYSEIDKMNGAFITGTSLKVLPINAIASHRFNQIPPLTKKLMMLYDQLIEKDIES